MECISLCGKKEIIDWFARKQLANGGLKYMITSQSPEGGPDHALQLPFEVAKHSMLHCARHGKRGEIFWPDRVMQ